MKNIVVCMKQVLDPEAPLSLFKIDPEAKRAILPKATPPVLSPFDENALEAALKIKDSQPAKVTVISLGKKLSRAVVRAPLAAGADELILLEDDLFDEFNTLLTAHALSSAIRNLGQYDLILCGIQAADTNAGQVGIGIASILDIPFITFARKVELIGNTVRVEKVLPHGFAVIEAPAPAVVSTSYEAGELREPGVEAFMSASKKPVTVMNAQQLGMTTVPASPVSFRKMYQLNRERKCEIITGNSPSEKVDRLMSVLQQAKVL